MSSHGYWEAPKEPVSLDVLIEMFPTLRQSLLSKFDDCALSSLLELKFSRGWNTHPQARGQIFHRFAAEVLRELQRQQSATIPVQVAEAILIEVCRQRHVPPEEIVRVPLRQMPELRMVARKFARDNSFSWNKIIDIEQRLSATLRYPDEHGQLRERVVTGQLDALLADPPDGAVVIDWKDSWALPPEPKEKGPEQFVGDDDELRGLSYHGYFQQRFYGWLVMKNYSNVNRVTLREYYARKTKARKATLTRDRLDEVEEELSILVQAFDQAMTSGTPPWPFGTFPDGAGGHVVDIEQLGAWKPQPGKHCGFCAASRHCPIEEDARIEAGGAITSFERAKRAAGELQVVEQVKKVLVEATKGWVETQGAPIPVKASKGRRVLGWYETRGGRRFGLYTPDESDRGGHADLDEQLAEAMREATARAKETRKRPRHGKVGKV